MGQIGPVKKITLVDLRVLKCELVEKDLLPALPSLRVKAYLKRDAENGHDVITALEDSRSLYLDVVGARSHNLLDEGAGVAAGVVVGEVVNGIVLTLLKLEIHPHVHLGGARDVLVAEEGTRQHRMGAQREEDGGGDRQRVHPDLDHHDAVSALQKWQVICATTHVSHSNICGGSYLSSLSVLSSGGNPAKPLVHFSNRQVRPVDSSQPQFVSAMHNSREKEVIMTQKKLTDHCSGNSLARSHMAVGMMTKGREGRDRWRWQRSGANQ